MASPKELAQELPDTLPEDFSEWDGKASAVRPPVNAGERDAWEAADSFAETQKPVWQSDESEAYLASLVDGSRASGSASSAPAFLKQQEDFVSWDSEATPAAWPVDRTEWDEWESAHSFSKAQKPPAHSAERETFVAPVVDRPRESTSAALAVVKQQETASELLDASPSLDADKPEAHTTPEVAAAPSSPVAVPSDSKPTSTEPATTRRKADEAVFQLFSAKKAEVKEEPKTAKKKWITIAAISAGSILLPLILTLTLLHHGSKTSAKHSVQPLPGAGETQQATNTPDPSANKPQAQGKPLPTTDKQQTTANQPTTEDPGTTSAPVPPTMMNDQLTAPARIPKQQVEDAPPPAGSDTAGADGLGGNANPGMFNGHAQPSVRVAPSRPIAISSGVAIGMLIQKSPPEYPPLAKTAHVAGTVELHATISKDGRIKDLQAVSGPVMLRQAALDAVRNWRYKPYTLNNEPVEVETTINVVFSLGG